LAGAVGTGQPVAAARRERRRDVLEENFRAEPHRHTLNRDHGTTAKKLSRKNPLFYLEWPRTATSTTPATPTRSSASCRRRGSITGRPSTERRRGRSTAASSTSNSAADSGPRRSSTQAPIRRASFTAATSSPSTSTADAATRQPSA